MGSDPNPIGLPARGLSRSRLPLRRADEVFRLQYGKALVASSRQEGHVPVYGTNGRCGWHDVALREGPGVVLGRKGQGPLGVEWCDEAHWVIDTAYSLDLLAEDVDLKYAYYLIKYVGLNHLKDGTSNPSLSRDTFGLQLLPVPTMPEQRQVVGILEALDDKIELNRLMSRTLDETAQAIFKSWFVDFDGVEIDDATCIPIGWRRTAFSETVDILSGGTPKTSVNDYWHGDIPWFAIADLPAPGEVFVMDTAKQVTELGIANSAAAVLPAGTTILTARGTVGERALAGVEMAINQSCFGLRGPYDESGYYTYRATGQVVHLLKQYSHGSVFSTINRATFTSVEVIDPPRETVLAYENTVAPMMERIRLNNLQSGTLKAMRDVLMPKLLSGDIRVSDAERAVEKAV